MPYKDPAAKRANAKAWKAANPDKVRVMRKKSRAKNAAQRRAYDLAYDLAHPEKSLARSKRWRQRHPEHVRAKSRAYREANAEILRAKRRAKRLAHLEETRAKERAEARQRPRAQLAANMRALRQAKPEQVHATERAYRLAHPEKVRLKNTIRRTRKHALPATFTLNDAAFCRAYFQYACAVCDNEEGFQWTIAMDHWVPLSSPACPGTIATNMIPLCHGLGGCNNSKNDKDPEQWLIERFGPRRATLILRKIHAYFAVVVDRQQRAS